MKDDNDLKRSGDGWPASCATPFIFAFQHKRVRLHSSARIRKSFSVFRCFYRTFSFIAILKLSTFFTLYSHSPATFVHDRPTTTTIVQNRAGLTIRGPHTNARRGPSYSPPLPSFLFPSFLHPSLPLSNLPSPLLGSTGPLNPGRKSAWVSGISSPSGSGAEPQPKLILLHFCL